MNKKGVEHLHVAKLRPFDVNVFNNLRVNRGEIEWYPETKKPIVNEYIDVLVRKGLVEITNADRTLVIPQGAIPASVGSVVRQYGSRLRLRATDEGLCLMARLDEMAANPMKLESG